MDGRNPTHEHLVSDMILLLMPTSKLVPPGFFTANGFGPPGVPTAGPPGHGGNAWSQGDSRPLRPALGCSIRQVSKW